MTHTTIDSTASSPSVFLTLMPIMAVVLLAFTVIGLALPVLPLHVHQGLGLGTFVVGLVTGSQFAASLVSRVWAGHFADDRGAKITVVVGLVAAAVSGNLYLISLPLTHTPWLSVTVLLLGRALLGAAESFIITGALSWGLGLVDHRSAGKVIAWVGTAMYAAFALGAPVGSILFDRYGFVSIALATVVIPLAALVMVLGRRGTAPSVHAQRVPMRKVIGMVWVPGVGLALSSIGFGAMTAFISLLFADRGWTPVWLAFSAFAAAFIVARSLLGHLPDKLGGAKVALVFVVVEAAGQFCIWLAPGPGVALVGAVLSGLGYSLVYPGLGVEAVRGVPPQSRGLAMGTYTAFLDLALGVTTPILGIIAGWSGLRVVFLVGGVLAIISAGVSARLIPRER
ncbi:arabinose transporter [Ralstonia pseudosolanacearum]|uniref:arabinose transporter n=1 Tax=Ralstonia pseudosolanacearum TaxID=1310165 RepID=UPI001FFBB237|nr:arabinose transporter [Ralstonia pseudosolanacearum]